MKILPRIVFLIYLISYASTASAFTDNYTGYSIDLPKDWTTESVRGNNVRGEDMSGVRFKSPDKNSSFTIRSTVTSDDVENNTFSQRDLTELADMYQESSRKYCRGASLVQKEFVKMSGAKWATVGFDCGNKAGEVTKMFVTSHNGKTIYLNYLGIKNHIEKGGAVSGILKSFKFIF